MSTYTARLPVRRPTRWYLLGRGLSRLANLTVAVAAAGYALPRVPSTPLTLAAALVDRQALADRVTGARHRRVSAGAA